MGVPTIKLSRQREDCMIMSSISKCVLALIASYFFTFFVQSFETHLKKIGTLYLEMFENIS